MATGALPVCSPPGLRSPPSSPWGEHPCLGHYRHHRRADARHGSIRTPGPRLRPGAAPLLHRGHLHHRTGDHGGLPVAAGRLFPLRRPRGAVGDGPAPRRSARRWSSRRSASCPWLSGLLLFPPPPCLRFGRWSPELMSQQVLSPLVNGFLAAATIVPAARLALPPHDRAARLSRTAASPRCRARSRLGVRARLLVFLLAVAFVPLFTLLGLIRAGGDARPPGLSATDVVDGATSARPASHLLPLRRARHRPHADPGALADPAARRGGARAAARAARRPRRPACRSRSGDEVGVLEDGVNAMVTALRDTRAHPADLRPRRRAVGARPPALRRPAASAASCAPRRVLFCDLRGFTAMAERTPPAGGRRDA